LKVKPHVIEQMLNHQPLNKLIAIYQRATYAEEQKTAWLAWSEMVEHQIAKEPSNVIPINRTATN
ncbi:MAG TPA: site-specific integrase, partial [Gammaproteobacteria bacterium]|nr:site-specific integrase [Gammaproteobacteria bacterium]